MKLPISILIILFITGCKTSDKAISPSGQPLAETTIPKREYSIQSVLWQQNAAEYKALCYQAFNAATMYVDNLDHIEKSTTLPQAIIVDIDETLLDNSPYNATLIRHDTEYNKATWVEWGKLKSATAVPGSVDFLNYAASKGITIIYLSNRYHSQLPETMENLKSLGFPDVVESNFLLRVDTSNKEERRNTVAESYDIILLIGDNLSDFSDIYYKESSSQRNTNVEKDKSIFGHKYIILPNPMYGDWESSGIYEDNYNWTESQKDSIRNAKLKTY